jgi:hypothetical protein
MDTFPLRMFQRQVALQCRYILMSGTDIRAAIVSTNKILLFYALQNLLNATANISKACWGQGGKLRAQREPLRLSLGITDASPFFWTNMRNNFEHLDERIDMWAASSQHNFVDFNLGPRSSYWRFNDEDIFRLFDTATGTLVFWGDEFNAPAIIAEAERVLPIAYAEGEKAHFSEADDLFPNGTDSSQDQGP